MFKFQIATHYITFDLCYEDDQFSILFRLGEKVIFNKEKSFTKMFKCIKCGQKVFNDGQIVKFCDLHREEFVQEWEERLYKDK